MLVEGKKNRKSCRRFFSNHKAMTLIEILLVVSLISGISVTLYQALVNGINVWKKTQELVVEEDIAIFLDKISFDLRNAPILSQIKFDGSAKRFSFPTMVQTLADSYNTLAEPDYIQQIGRVEYSYDSLEKKIIKRTANYGLALDNRYLSENTLVHSVENVEFSYYYFSDQGEVTSDIVLDIQPAGVEIKVEFSDNEQKKMMKRYIEIPIGS